MLPSRRKLRPRVPALWLGIAALVLQAFGAALHAYTHHDRGGRAPLSVAHHTTVADTHDSPNDNHAHCHGHAPAHTPDHTHAAPSDHPRHTSHRTDPASPDDHSDCPTCLKLLSNARTAFASSPEPPFIAKPSREPPTLGAERALALAALRSQPVRGPPMRAPAIA